MYIDQYFPLEVTLTHDDNVYSLLDEMGAKGLGAYLLMLIELRCRDNYECDASCLKSVARTARMKLELVEDVVYKYNLFIIKFNNETKLISSVYLNRVMQKLEERRKKQSEAGKRTAEKTVRSLNGRYTSLAGTAEHNIAKHSNKEKTNKKEEAEINIPSWEKYIDEAMNDEIWMDLQSMSSRMGHTFLSRKDEIFKAFKNHVLIQGTEKDIVSLRDAKSYFANFIRNGTVTRKRLMEMLEEAKKKELENDVYRFEQIDKKTGARSYYGHPIPPDAPPRPADDSLWNPVLLKWEKYR